MNLNELRAAGGFIESALVRKEITWTRVPAGRKKAVSDTFQVFVRRNSFGAVERLFSAEGDQQSRNARYLAECIRLGETGEESLTYEQAYDLDPALGFLLLQAVGEVNRVEDAEKTDPRRRGLARTGAERRRRVDHCRGQERLSYAEYRAWVAYLNKRGSLHPGHRLELALARIAALLGHALGADADPDAFRPHMALQPLSLHQAMDQWA